MVNQQIQSLEEIIGRIDDLLDSFEGDALGYLEDAISSLEEAIEEVEEGGGVVGDGEDE